MAKEASFDVVSEIDFPELENAIQNARKEIVARFDFKGADPGIVLEKKETIVLTAKEPAKVRSVWDVLQSKLVRRGVPLRNLEPGEMEDALGGTARQRVKITNGIPIETAKEIVQFIKERKRKVQASIQAAQVRVSGKSRDDLQAVIADLKGGTWPVDLQFKNFR